MDTFISAWIVDPNKVLISGIRKVEGFISGEYFLIANGEESIFLNGNLNKTLFLTKEDAIEKAEKIKKAKIIIYQNKIKSLQKIKFD